MELCGELYCFWFICIGFILDIMEVVWFLLYCFDNVDGDLSYVLFYRVVYVYVIRFKQIGDKGDID